MAESVQVPTRYTHTSEHADSAAPKRGRAGVLFKWCPLSLVLREICPFLPPSPRDGFTTTMAESMPDLAMAEARPETEPAETSSAEAAAAFLEKDADEAEAAADAAEKYTHLELGER